MQHKDTPAPDSTAVRTALWRAIHVQADAVPHVLDDEIGLRLAAPDEGWRNRPDMASRARRFGEARYVSTADLTARYFAGRADGLRPATGEAFLVATV